MISAFFRKFSVLLVTLTLLVGLGLADNMGDAAAQTTDNIRVTLDRAKVVRVDEPASTVIIGNPGIADATVQDTKTLVITGRSFGVTNMIILDQEGEVMVDTLLTVRAEPVNALTVFRRTVRETFSCSPNCERSVSLGDGEEQFNAVSNQVQQRNSFANGQDQQN